MCSFLSAQLQQSPEYLRSNEIPGHVLTLPHLSVQDAPSHASLFHSIPLTDWQYVKNTVHISPVSFWSVPFTPSPFSLLIDEQTTVIIAFLFISASPAVWLIIDVYPLDKFPYLNE